jgi:hypothetical protein
MCQRERAKQAAVSRLSAKGTRTHYFRVEFYFDLQHTHTHTTIFSSIFLVFYFIDEIFFKVIKEKQQQ